MSILDRESLQASPLADLHAVASELSIDGYRRLRKAELIDAILERQGGSAQAASSDDDGDAGAPPDLPEGEQPEEPQPREQPEPRARRGRRGGRAAPARAGAGPDRAGAASARAGAGPDRAGAASASAGADDDARGRPAPREDDQIVDGVVELLPNGSGFLRVAPPDPSDDDIYISAAQVKRCELVSGDRIAGPKRPPRRSERFASLIRIDTVNDQAVSELTDGARFDELPAGFPDQRLSLGSDDPTLKAIEWLTPFGRGSRVTIIGPPRSGKSEALLRIAKALPAVEEIQVFVALAGVRPEEISAWGEGPVTPAASLSFAASADAQDNAVELVVDQARRLAARGAHPVVLIDTLDGMHEHAARKALAAARKIVDGGSLTVIATATEPVGGETTVIALDLALTSARRFPALDLRASGSIRPELLVGEAGAQAIAAARLELDS